MVGPAVQSEDCQLLVDHELFATFTPSVWTRATITQLHGFVEGSLYGRRYQGTTSVVHMSATSETTYGRNSVPTSALSRAPLIPHPSAFTIPELGSEEARTRVEITRAANATISAVRSLSCGDVIEGKAELGSTGSWKRAGSLAQSASCGILRGVIEDYRWSGEVSTGTLASTPASDEESYRFVTAKSNCSTRVTAAAMPRR